MSERTHEVIQQEYQRKAMELGHMISQIMDLKRKVRTLRIKRDVLMVEIGDLQEEAITLVEAQKDAT